MRARSRSRRAFSLVEVMIAILIGGIAISSAHRILVQLSASQAAVEQAATSADERANGERMLRDLISHAEVSSPALSDSAPGGLEGNSQELSVPSMCARREGWRERCVVVLRVSHGGSDSRSDAEGWTVEAITSRTDPAIVMRSKREIKLRYLSTAADGGMWVDSWRPDVALPAGVGVVTPTDTVFLRVRTVAHE